MMGLFSFLFNDRRRSANPRPANEDDLEKTTLIRPSVPEKEAAHTPSAVPDPSEDVSDATMVVPHVRTRSLSEETDATPAAAGKQATDDLVDAISAAVQSRTAEQMAKDTPEEQISATIQSQLHQSQQPAMRPDLDDLIPDEEPSAPAEPDMTFRRTEPEEPKIEEEDELEKTRLFAPHSPRFASSAAESEEPETVPEESAVSSEEPVSEESTQEPVEEPVPEEKPDGQTICNTAEPSPDPAGPSCPVSAEPEEATDPVQEPNPVDERSELTVDSTWGTNMYSEPGDKPIIPNFSDECFRMTWKLKGTGKKRRLRAIADCTKGQPVFVVCDSDGTHCTIITEDGQEIGRLSEQDSAIYHSMVAGSPHNLYIKKIRSSQFEKTTVKILVIVRNRQEARI